MAYRDPLLVDLALQGGGSHGAFTWGVLDRLLEEPWLEIDGISGTSAGAMNAAVLADGSCRRRRRAARARRSRPSGARSRDAAHVQPAPGAARSTWLLGRWTLDYSPALRRHGPDVARSFSPYDLNPAGMQSAARRSSPRASISTRLAARADQALRHRDQCAHRPRPRVPQRRHHARGAAGLGLPADDVPGGRDRRRGLLGWRLFRQSRP